MAVSLEDVRARLDPEEPDYEEAANLGAAAVPHLLTLSTANDPLLASKAVSLAGFIGGEPVFEVMKSGAKHADPTVRVATAAAAQRLDKSLARRVATLLHNDPDRGVRTRVSQLRI